MCMKIKKIGVSVLLTSSFLLSGCFYDRPVPGDAAYAPVSPENMMPPENTSGSIYQEGYNMVLFEDQRARRIGDIITIVLTETTSASKSASTSVDKTNSTDITNPTLLGSTPQFNAPGIIPLASNTGNNLNFGLDSSNSFSGDGSSDQSNSLSGNITVTVHDVLPNGNMKIRGEKWMTLNTGDEYIRLTGIVRPQDIRPDNSVLSTRVADARITYSGRGEIAESNKMGWLSKFFVTALWPF